MTTLPTLYRLLGASALIATMAACSTASVAPPATTPLPDMLAQAAQAASAGQNAQALTLWKAASAAHPADKTAWGHLAKAKFDAAQYGDAIVNAQEVLVRDPNDRAASTIVATSALRLASRALADLGRQGAMPVTLQKDALDVARVLRESAGRSELLASVAQQERAGSKERDTRAPRVAKVSKPRAADCAASDPFCQVK